MATPPSIPPAPLPSVKVTFNQAWLDTLLLGLAFPNSSRWKSVFKRDLAPSKYTSWSKVHKNLENVLVIVCEAMEAALERKKPLLRPGEPDSDQEFADDFAWGTQGEGWTDSDELYIFYNEVREEEQYEEYGDSFDDESEDAEEWNLDNDDDENDENEDDVDKEMTEVEDEEMNEVEDEEKDEEETGEEEIEVGGDEVDDQDEERKALHHRIRLLGEVIDELERLDQLFLNNEAFKRKLHAACMTRRYSSGYPSSDDDDVEMEKKMERWSRRRARRGRRAYAEKMSQRVESGKTNEVAEGDRLQPIVID